MGIWSTYVVRSARSLRFLLFAAKWAINKYCLCELFLLKRNSKQQLEGCAVKKIRASSRDLLFSAVFLSQRLTLCLPREGGVIRTHTLELTVNFTVRSY